MMKNCKYYLLGYCALTRDKYLCVHNSNYCNYEPKEEESDD